MLQLSAPARERNNVDACTVAALDAITAFAVPNPNCPSQSRRFFQVQSPCRSPRPADHSVYFGLAQYYCANPFDRRRCKVTRVTIKVNANYWCNRMLQGCAKPKAQMV